MKLFLIGIGILFATSAFAVPPSETHQGHCINAAQNNILPTYSPTSPGSVLLQLQPGTSASHFAITENTLASDVNISVASNPTDPSPTPSAALITNPYQMPLGSNLTLVFDSIRTNRSLLVASRTGAAITSGIICVTAW